MFLNACNDVCSASRDARREVAAWGRVRMRLTRRAEIPGRLLPETHGRRNRRLTDDSTTGLVFFASRSQRRVAARGWVLRFQNFSRAGIMNMVSAGPGKGPGLDHEYRYSHTKGTTVRPGEDVGPPFISVPCPITERFQAWVNSPPGSSPVECRINECTPSSF